MGEELNALVFKVDNSNFVIFVQDWPIFVLCALPFKGATQIVGFLPLLMSRIFW